MPVKIYKPTKTAMQSGKAKAAWVLEFEQENTRTIDPLMGWSSNQDTKPQVKLTFSSLEKAVKYAQEKNLEYNITTPNQKTLHKQAYAENFTGS